LKSFEMNLGWLLNRSWPQGKDILMFGSKPKTSTLIFLEGFWWGQLDERVQQKIPSNSHLREEEGKAAAFPTVDFQRPILIQNLWKQKIFGIFMLIKKSGNFFCWNFILPPKERVWFSFNVEGLKQISSKVSSDWSNNQFGSLNLIPAT